MAMAIAFDEAKKNQRRINANPRIGTTGGGASTNFFGTRDTPGLPHAALSQLDPGRVSYPHFHKVDQFQVMIEGKGKMGRHDLAAYSVHFSRAYTPYGPFISDAATGLTCFILHANTQPDWDASHLPQEREKLKQVLNRQPWQVTSQATFPAFQSGKAAADIMLQAIPGMKDEYGLAGYTLSMKPNARVKAPDPSQGEGQYLAVVKGSVLHNDREHTAPALVFVYPHENPLEVHAGGNGLEALILNFPQSKSRAPDSKLPSTAPGFKKWQCALCSFSYDEALGMPGEGIPAGTRWQDVPGNWTCPDCGTSKAEFQMIELTN